MVLYDLLPIDPRKQKTDFVITIACEKVLFVVTTIFELVFIIETF